MLKTETLQDGRIRYFSDSGMMLRQIETGELYEDAAHNAPVMFSYEETDQPISEDVGVDEALGILLGGAT